MRKARDDGSDAAGNVTPVISTFTVVGVNRAAASVTHNARAAMRGGDVLVTELRGDPNGRATFDLIRERLGPRVGLTNLVASMAVTLLTFTAEIGGIALVGSEVMECWNADGYYIPGLHTKPLGDKDPAIAPNLNTLRESLQSLAGRPVNFQATSNIVLFARDVLMSQPYFMLIEPTAEP